MKKAAPKAAKKKGADKSKLTGPKAVSKDPKHGIGHNSGEKNPEAIKCVEELMRFQEQKKSIAKAERDVRNRLKIEFGIMSSSVAREIALRKMDPDVRVQVESNHDDFKKMLGYQPSLDFVGAAPTAASVKAQPSEEPKEGFEVHDEAAAEQDNAEAGEEMPAIPENLRHTGVISREG